jgi:hypothetical protein
MKYLDFFKYKTPSAEVVDRCWKGGIDMHIHFAPDLGVVRRFDGYQTALAAKDAGMRAIVLKSPHIPTIQTAFACNAIPGMEGTEITILEKDGKLKAIVPKILEK